MRRKTCIFRNFVILFMAIGLFATFVGCKNDDNPDQVDEKVRTLRTELTQQMDAKAKSLQDQLDEAKAKLNELSNGSVTSAQLEAAKQEVLNATITKEAFEQYKTAMEARFDKAASVEELNLLKDKYTDIESRVAALESLTGGNLAKTLADLKAEFNGLLDQKVDALEAKIASNKAELLKLLEDYKAVANKNIADNTTRIKELEDKVAKMEKDLNVSVVSGMLNSRLTSLVLLPDYVSANGGSLPVVLFSPLETVNCGKISPAVEVKYVVSPSTVKASDIDIKNLKFRYNDPRTMKTPDQSKLNLTAEFVSLNNGILTVKANLNLDETWVANPKENTQNRIDQIMLEVPTAKGDVVVSSDWAKVDFKARTAEIVKTPKKAAADAWSNYVLKPKVAEAKAIDVANNAQNHTVVDMVWKQDLDLRSVVKSMYSNWEDFAPSTYGLSFSFDMNDENGQKIVYPLGNNNTDQQEFIKIHADGHTVSTKVYGLPNGNKAAVGRTPIVHVMLKTADGCLVKEGFIKLNIIDEVIPPVDIDTFKGKHEAVCGVNRLYHVDTKTMNEKIYHKLNISKEDFHKNYVFAMVPLDASDANNIGVIRQLPDNGGPESYNLVYELTEAQAWSHIGETVWAEATYTYGTSVVKVRFEVAITREKLNLDLLIDNYWYNGYKNIVQNVRIPAAGDTNPALATFENNINNAFVTVKGGNVLNLNNNIVPNNKYDNYTYEYVFDKDEVLIGSVDGIKISVSANQKELLATKNGSTQVVAEIKPQSNTAGDVLEYKSTDFAKYLLNKGPEFMAARVVLQVKNTCGRQVDVEVKKLADKDRFNVHFLRPVNVAPQAGDNFVDGVDFGKKGSYLDMKQVAKLSDWRNYIKNVNLYDFLPNNENYYDYYGVQNVKADIKNIKTEGLVGSSPDLASTIKVEQTPNNEVFDGDLYKYGRLTYKNNGNNLDKEFTLIVPVTVEYKWGAVKTEVRVKVKPTSTKAKK